MRDVFSIDEMLNVSKKLNAKTSLLALSKKYGFSIPQAELFSFSELSLERLKPFQFPERAVYLKMDGLGGGANVKRIETAEELEKFIALNQKEAPSILVQEAIPSDFKETEHIFMVYPDHAEYIYPSIQLTVGSSWYANLFEASPKLTAAQKNVLEKGIKALQEEGYADPRGLLVGFDSLAKDDEMYIIEINARWLGSFPVQRLLAKLNLFGKEEVFSSFDYILEGEFEKYKTFAENHLYNPQAPISHTISSKGVQDGASDLFSIGRGHCQKDKVSPIENKGAATDCTDFPRECEKWGLDRGEFSFIPLAFSPYSTKGKRSVYYIVCGNLEAVIEVISDDRGDTYRAVYTIKFKEVVYVLQVFKKKSTKGIGVPKKDRELLETRLKSAAAHYKEWLKSEGM